MKKILIFLLIFISARSFGQYPQLRTTYNDSTISTPMGALKSRLINYPFADTSAANLQRVRQYPGAQIFTISDNKFWLRNSTATAWISVGSGGGGVTVSSFSKNAGRDSTILVLSDGSRLAVKDSVGNDSTLIYTDYTIDTSLTANPGFVTISVHRASLDSLYHHGLDSTGGLFDGASWRYDLASGTWKLVLFPTYPGFSVTGYNVDNSDPQNPVILPTQVDGVTITGTGVVGDPFVATGRRFGIEDSTGIQDRAVNMQNHSLNIDSLSSSNMISHDGTNTGVNFNTPNDIGFTTSSASVNTGVESSINAGIPQTTMFTDSTGLSHVIDIFPKRIKFGGDNGTGHITVQFQNLDTLSSPTTYIAAFDGDTLKKVAYPAVGGVGTVTSFSKTDNYGITSSVTNPTTTPNHAIAVDSATLSLKYIRRVDSVNSITGYTTLYQNSLKGRVDSIRFVNSGLIHTTPAAFALSGQTAVITQTLATQTANTVLAGPASGGAATPTFRALVTADLPTTTVTPGSYTNTNLTVDAQGRLTAASNGSGGSAYVDSLYRNSTLDSLIYTKNSNRYHLKGWNDSDYVNLTVLNDSTIVFRRDNGGKDTIRLSTPQVFTNLLNGLVPASGDATGAKVLHSDGTWKDTTAAAGSGWSLTGNASTNGLTNFIGTTDNQSFNIKVNNVRAGHIDSLNTGGQTATFGRTSLGYEAGLQWLGTNKGGRSTYLGYRAGKSQDSTDNTVVGFGSFIASGSSTLNTIVGAGSGKLLTSGNNNTIIGASSGNGHTTASGNIFIGYNIANNNTGSSNVTIGGAMGTGTGGQNVGVGVSALSSVTNGNQNVAVGFQALLTNAASNSQTAVGAISLTSTTGTSNAALGAFSGKYNTTGANQIFINSLDRTNYAGDTTGSPLYVQQSTTLASQKIDLNGMVGINTTNPASTAVLDIPASTHFRGVLIPRMTTTKRDSLTSSVLTSTKTANGSGYTNGTYTNVPLTGGTGTGAMAASVVIAGGAFSSYTLSTTLGGVGYVVGDVLTLTTASVGGTGSGGQITVSTTGAAISEGLHLWDNTLHKGVFFDGTRWTEVGKILSGSATLDFPSTASLAFQALTITVTGAADGDVVSVGVPNGSFTGGLLFTARVSAANTVSIQCYNSTLGAIDPASGTFNVKVFKD